MILFFWQPTFETLNVFEDFKSVRGLKLNKDKTVVMTKTAHTVGKQEIISLGLNRVRQSRDPILTSGFTLISPRYSSFWTNRRTCQ